MRNLGKTALLLPVTLTLLAAAPAHAGGRGANTELYVVPAPPGVVIDGSLDDWDLSAAVVNYVIPETLETQSARIAMMYDDEALYIGGIVRDSSPMMNRHDPQTNPSRAWDADVCQIFFSLDPDAEQPLPYSSFNPEHRQVDVATMLLWYYSDRSEPALAMFRGMRFVDPLRPDLSDLGNVPAEHFEAAYRKGEDGLSYTFEYRIPWATLATVRKPQAGDDIAATVAVFWGRPDGLKTAGGSAWAWNVMSQPGFPFQQASTWGTLRFHEHGDIPREWVDGHLPVEQPLPLRLAYSLPREGEATIQLFNERNEAVRILVPQQFRPEGVNTERWDGRDDHGEPLPPGRYTWRGHVGDPIKPEYRFSAHNSGQPPYPTDDNTGGWGADHGTPTTVLAVDDGMILAWNSAEFGWGILGTDRTGRKQWGSKLSADHLATDGTRLFFAGRSFAGDTGVRVMDMENSRPLNFQPGMGALPVPEGADRADASGLAYGDGRIFVAYRVHDLVAVHDANGEMLGTLPVPAPGALAMAANGALLVISEGKVLRVASRESLVQASKDSRPATSDQRVVIDSGLDQPQALAVDADGAIYVSNQGALQNISVFSADGTFLRSIGKAGGRAARGQYEADGMFRPRGLSVDGDGRVWVAEHADYPKRISVWDGQTGAFVKEFFGGSGYFAYGFIDPARPGEILAHNVLWSIDWDTGETAPLTTIWRKTAPDEVGTPSPEGYLGNVRLVTADNGEQYLFGRARHFSVLMRREGDLFKPFAAVFEINRGGALYYGTGISLFQDADTYPNGFYFWQDRNNDQTVQPDELVRLPRAYDRGLSGWLDADLTSHLNTGHILSPVEVTDAGQPIYDLDAAIVSPVRGKPGASLPYAHLWRDTEGSTYTFQEGGTLTGWDDAGEPLWRYPRIESWRGSLGKPIAGPGRLWGMTGPMGVAGDFFAMMTYFGPNHIIRRDGTYVGVVLKDGRLGIRGAYEGQPEGQGGSFVKLNFDGQDRYFIIHGGQDVRVWEVKGLDELTALEGDAFELSAEEMARANREYEDWKAGLAGQQALRIVRGRDALDDAPAIERVVDEQRRFAVRMAVDETNLYVRYEVTAPHGLINAVPEDWLIFRGGNCLDLQLATDSEADPERKTPAPGDLRLLVTKRDGAPYAMLYRPRVAGFEGERIVLESPTGTEPFDRIEQVDVGLDVQSAADGFIAVVTVPLDTIGWRPEPDSTHRADVGYIFGNATGTRAAVRAYWSNNGFSANVVDDIPNESRLEPHEWGEATVE